MDFGKIFEGVDKVKALSYEIKTSANIKANLVNEGYKGTYAHTIRKEDIGKGFIKTKESAVQEAQDEVVATDAFDGWVLKKHKRANGTTYTELINQEKNIMDHPVYYSHKDSVGYDNPESIPGQIKMKVLHALVAWSDTSESKKRSVKEENIGKPSFEEAAEVLLANSVTNELETMFEENPDAYIPMPGAGEEIMDWMPANVENWEQEVADFSTRNKDLINRILADVDPTSDWVEQVAGSYLAGSFDDNGVADKIVGRGASESRAKKAADKRNKKMEKKPAKESTVEPIHVDIQPYTVDGVKHYRAREQGKDWKFETEVDETLDMFRSRIMNSLNSGIVTHFLADMKVGESVLKEGYSTVPIDPKKALQMAKGGEVAAASYDAAFYNDTWKRLVASAEYSKDHTPPIIIFKTKNGEWIEVELVGENV